MMVIRVKFGRPREDMNAYLLYKRWHDWSGGEQ
jgi:hypothetical protein